MNQATACFTASDTTFSVQFLIAIFLNVSDFDRAMKLLTSKFS